MFKKLLCFSVAISATAIVYYFGFHFFLWLYSVVMGYRPTSFVDQVLASFLTYLVVGWIIVLVLAITDKDQNDPLTGFGAVFIGWLVPLAFFVLGWYILPVGIYNLLYWGDVAKAFDEMFKFMD